MVFCFYKYHIRKMKEYKPSMFNYITRSDNDEMVIYNTFIGSKSICKVQSSTEEIFFMLII